MSTDEQVRAIERVDVEVDEGFHVRDEQSANWVLRKIVEERTYR